MKKKLVGHLKQTGEKVFKHYTNTGLISFFVVEKTGASTVNGLLKPSDIEFLEEG